LRAQLAKQFLQSGQVDTARTLCLQALADDPRDLAAVRLLIRIYEQQGDEQALVDMLQRAHSLDPDDVWLAERLGALWRERGRFDEARDAFGKVLARNPEHSAAHYNLAMITRFTAHDAQLDAMLAWHGRTAPGSRDRRLMAFALGKAFDDLRDYDRAFVFFAEGNAIAHAGSKYSVDADRRRFDTIRRIFDAAFLRRCDGAGFADRTPIFVTGLPRSGTTLIEQILASHPDVCGGGELPNLYARVEAVSTPSGERFPEAFDRLGPEALRPLARGYLDVLEALAGGRPRVTDKSIANFFYIGLIAALLPNAAIVNVHRDPRDQGLSLFQKYLPEQPYGYDLCSIGQSYLLYQDLLGHWDRLLPRRILRLRYEAIVTDPEASVRRLLDHCGLPFDAACLSFHETDRVVKTASEAQVRQPLYTGAIGRWKGYRKHLGPLLDALGPDLAGA
jgi:tetratricopeptide (TPR) repeat protein